MRTLEINKDKLWYVEFIREEDVIDDYGYFTGEKTPIYSSPEVVKLTLYPNGGNIMTDTFGKYEDIKMVSVSTNVILNKNGLLFDKLPINNYDNYTYKVSKISRSINGYQYGLKGRV